MSETPPLQPNPQLPQLVISPDINVEYVNLVRIAHSISELVFDFAQLLPGTASAHVQSRIIMTPLGAKLFFKALADNLTRYESAFGEIKIPGGGSLADQLFHPPPPDKPPSG
jgi:hypothetical protein